MSSWLTGATRGLVAFAVIVFAPAIGCGGLLVEEPQQTPSLGPSAPIQHRLPDTPVISGNWGHTCIVRRSGTLYCWGYGRGGALGNNSTADQVEPVQVGEPAIWRTVSAGTSHTCAIRLDGSLWCWGSNMVGQVGASTDGLHLVPTRVGADRDWVRVVVGGGHTCGLRGNGSLWCWGGRDYGGLTATGGEPPGAKPKQRTTFTDWVDLSADYYAVCGVRANGSLWCAYDDDSVLFPYQARVGDPPAAFAFAQERPERQWRSVAMAINGLCATRADNTWWCWKRRQPGTLMEMTEPEQVPSQVGWSTAIASGYHGCAIDLDRRVWCLGRNDTGQLGDGAKSKVDQPLRRVEEIDDVIAISAGGWHSCAVRSDGVVWCWGMPNVDERGNGEVIRPTRVGGVLANP